MLSREIIKANFWVFDTVQAIELIVNLDCAGCESKIKKTLKKLKGISELYSRIRKNTLSIEYSFKS